MTNKRDNRRRQRSQLSSTSSEENSPATKKLTATNSDATRFGVPSRSANMPTAAGNLQVPEEVSQEEPSRGEIWKILINIQANVAKLLNENQELRKDIESLKESIQFSDEQVAIVKKENEELAQKNKVLENKVYDLEQQVRNHEFDHDALEQYTRKFNVEVHGIPECEGENLADIIIKIGQKISVDITSQDIDIVHRLRRKTPTTKPIIVRFTSYRKKREFYQARFNLKTTKISEIIASVQHEVEARIYINENLTQRRQELLAKARKMRKAKKLVRVWTSDGKLFVRKTEESRPVRISEDWDLENLATG